MMKNTYILMIIQALLTLLLFFSEGYVKYTTIVLFGIIDLILFFDLFTRRWSFEELLTLAAILCSGVFMLFYVFMKSSITTIFGVALMLLFLVIAMLDLISKPMTNKDRVNHEKLRLPRAPEQIYDNEYDMDYEPQPSKSQQSTQFQQPSDFQRRPEPVMHITPEKKSSEIKGKLAAKAVAYELEREAQQLKNAEKMVTDLKVYDTEKELIRETKILEDAQRQLSAMKAASRKAQAEMELKKEAAEIMKVQKQIDEIQKIKELEKEAKSLKKAEKQVKEVQFLNQQEKIVKQAKDIAKAQKEIDVMNKNTKKSIATQVSKQPILKDAVKIKAIKTVKTDDESFYFATENGNKFHEPGCLSIKKVPKNKLTLYTSKKDAMKKGLQPCSVCIPK
jgi:hypothetical protein